VDLLLLIHRMGREVIVDSDEEAVPEENAEVHQVAKRKPISKKDALKLKAKRQARDGKTGHFNSSRSFKQWADLQLWEEDA
jgi:hypothetical protein